MNRKDVVALGDKYTTIDTRGDAWFSLPVWALNELIAEVEQETLEHAAKHFADNFDRFTCMNNKHIARTLRELKDSHD